MTSRILVAGIGNIFLGDDGFGPEVVRRVAVRQGDAGDDYRTRVVDYGIRGVHLAYELLDGWDALVLVDAVPNRGSPGAVHMFEADQDTLSAGAVLDAHSMDPAAVFACLAALGGTPPYTIVVGCEVDNVDERIGLSEPVAAAVDPAVAAVEDAVRHLARRMKIGR